MHTCVVVSTTSPGNHRERRVASSHEVCGLGRRTAVMLSLSPQRVSNAVVFFDYLAVAAMRTILPYATKALAGSRSSMLLASLESAFGLGQVGGALTIGRLSDRHGRRVLLSTCLLCTALAYGLAGSALSTSSALLLLASRIPAGVSKQTTTTARAIVCDTTETSERAGALSTLYACSALGYAAGPLIGGVLMERGRPDLMAFAAACGFAFLTPAVATVLEETRPEQSVAPRTVEQTAAASSPRRSRLGGAWSQPALRRALLQAALPEAALVMHTAVAKPLLAQNFDISSTTYGRLSSLQGLAAAFLSLGPLRALFRRGILSESNALLIVNALLLGASTYLACRPSVTAIWVTVLPLALAVSLQRAMSATIVSKAAPPDAQGDALGALDAVSSICRICVPLLAGLLATRGSAQAPFAAMAALGALGMLICWAPSPTIGDAERKAE